MKNRIIQYLSEFAMGKMGDLGPEIQESLGFDEITLQEKSKEVLTKILHQYTQFSISTIDAFFQRVIRSFTRESGLLGNFRLEVENERVLEEVVAEMIDELGPEHAQLTGWVIQFSETRLIEGESWNISAALILFAKEIFKENYKAIETEIMAVRERISPNDFLERLKKEKKNFLLVMENFANEAMALLNANGIQTDDFSGKERGTALKYFKYFASGEFLEPTKTIEKSAGDGAAWAAKASPRRAQLTQLAESHLRPILVSMLEFSERNIVRLTTAELVENNFYAYGLLSDVTRKLREYKAENNLMLLSDASHFLNGIINQSDTPFIYEKVGSFYRHYLIDEFQDTSGLQWNNFKPLVLESLDQNNKSLIVGDVKQSIYRWRGSDLGLLQDVVEAEIGPSQTEKFALQENWRSAGNIVRFNNEIFSSAAKQAGAATGHELPINAFADVIQHTVKFKEKGFVRIEFIEKWKAKDDDGEEQALNKIPLLLEELQEKGVAPGDITILVRKNGEGQKIANFLMQYKNSAKAIPGINYEVVSNESLRLDAASSVLLLLSALRYLNNPDDAVSRGELVFESGDQQGTRSPEENERRFSSAGRRNIRGMVPDEFSIHAEWLVKLSLFELTETLIRIFKLGEDTRELTYLQSFQDVVLEFGGKDKNDIASFLKWWDEIKNERSITAAANTNAVNIFTIHKSKGLQFRYVIVPFCNWLMDHEIPPLIWVKSDEQPYAELGNVVVRYTSKLKTSFFEADYREEFAKAYLDNLNVLYVAFTRAEEGLLVMAPLPAEKKANDGKIRDVGELLYIAISESEELKKSFDGITTYSSGQIERLIPERIDNSVQPVHLLRYPSYDWRKKLVIRREGKEFFQDEQTYQRQKVNYGILMHTILSRIHYHDEVEEVLQRSNFEGLIIENERQPLLEKIKAMMAHPVIGLWFGKEWKVRTETPVILPHGKTARIDRVVSKHSVVKGQTRRKAIIIDYKTGEKKNADRNQVEEYATILGTMGYSDVEGYLVYLENLDVVQVMNKMNLNLGF